MENKKQGLAPWVGDEPRVLILGSLPGDESIARQAYYQNPRNSFFKIMRTLFPGEEQVGDKEKEFILSHHIALWDMLKSAEREGSSDKNIKNGIPNDVQGFLKEHPSIRAIVINGKGKKYKECFERHFPEVYRNYETLFLPQTASYIPFEEKLRAWSAVKGLVEDAPSQEAATRTGEKDNAGESRAREEGFAEGFGKSLKGCAVTVVVAIALSLYLSCGKSGKESGEPEPQTVTTEIDTVEPPVRTTAPAREEVQTAGSPYYDEGYEKGLADGQEDTNDGDYQAGYDDSNDYSGKDAADYRDGYSHGYEDGYEEVIELSEDGTEDIDEDLFE